MVYSIACLYELVIQSYVTTKRRCNQIFFTEKEKLQPVLPSRFDYIQRQLRHLYSVAKGPKFRPQNSKGALHKFVRPEKLAAEIPLNMLKKGRKGAELF
jgi:hypothetical protein